MSLLDSLHPSAKLDWSSYLLTCLQISHTILPSLPDNLSDLRGLKVLVLEECPAMSLLPACLPELFNLEKLSIIFLPLLTHLPKNLGQLKLLKVHLESCRSLGLPSFLTSMSSLRSLSFVDCPQITSLPDSISSLSRLSSLKLNHLSGLPHVPSTLPLLPSLVKLSLRWCTGLRALPNDLGSLSCLREVDLDGCRQLEVLPQSLLDRQNVTEVKGSWGSARN
ncbi:unnamed protein product [Closterium sp. NIES-54]